MLKYLPGLPFSQRQRTLRASRPPMGKVQFIADITATGGDSRAADMVWNAFSPP